MESEQMLNELKDKIPDEIKEGIGDLLDEEWLLQSLSTVFFTLKKLRQNMVQELSNITTDFDVRKGIAMAVAYVDLQISAIPLSDEVREDFEAVWQKTL